MRAAGCNLEGALPNSDLHSVLQEALLLPQYYLDDFDPYNNKWLDINTLPSMPIQSEASTRSVPSLSSPDSFNGNDGREVTIEAYQPQFSRLLMEESVRTFDWSSSDDNLLSKFPGKKQGSLYHN